MEPIVHVGRWYCLLENGREFEIDWDGECVFRETLTDEEILAFNQNLVARLLCHTRGANCGASHNPLMSTDGWFINPHDIVAARPTVISRPPEDDDEREQCAKGHQEWVNRKKFAAITENAMSEEA